MKLAKKQPMKTQKVVNRDIDLWNRYIRGEIPIRYNIVVLSNQKSKITIDLHGLTLNQAYELVFKTLSNKHHKQITVITGASGEIKRQFEFWLENPTLKKLYKRYKTINVGSYLILN